MKKKMLMLVLSLSIVLFGVSARAQDLGDSLTIYQQEDYWREQYESLKADYDRLVGTILPQVEALRSNLDEMKSELDDMRSELETSQADYKTLDIRYTSAVRDLNTRTTMMYAFIVTTVVFLATTLYLALRRKGRT